MPFPYPLPFSFDTMADIAVSMTVTQSSDGETLTFTDTTDYGGSTEHKTFFSDRVITMYSGLNPTVEITIPFPYTGTPDGTQDMVDYAITEDGAYAATLTLTPVTPSSTGYTSQIVFCATQFTENNKSQMLAQYTPSGDGNNIAVSYNICLIQAGIMAALARAQRGDIVQSYNIINFVQNKSQELILIA